jgi:hypothetical protein
MPAPCVTEGPTNSTKLWLMLSFIRLKRSQLVMQNTIVGLWQLGCIATAAAIGIKPLMQ